MLLLQKERDDDAWRYQTRLPPAVELRIDNVDDDDVRGYSPKRYVLGMFGPRWQKARCQEGPVAHFSLLNWFRPSQV